MSDVVLVINAGSSSIKFAIFSLVENNVPLRILYRGEIAGIGHRPRFTVHDRVNEIVGSADQLVINTENIQNHADAFFALFDWINHHLSEFLLIAVGHRVVHGGEKYSTPVVVSEEALRNLKEFIPLAPLHQPYQIAAIEVLAQQQSKMRQVACFDTAFHRSQPFIAQQFALPETLRQQGILKYGFHGLSYEYIANVLPEYLGGAAEGRVIVAHLGVRLNKRQKCFIGFISGRYCESHGLTNDTPLASVV